MNIANEPKQHVVAIHLPEPVPALIIFCQHVLLVMDNNKWFPSPTVPLATAKQHVDTLAECQVAVKSRTAGATETRDVARKLVVSDMGSLKAYVQVIVDKNPDDAATIAKSAGMSLKQWTVPIKAEFEARMGKSPGEVILRVKAASKRAAYHWQYSTDGGETWTDMGISTVAEKRLLGATVGTTYYFRYRTTVQHTTSDWSQTYRFLVH